MSTNLDKYQLRLYRFEFVVQFGIDLFIICLIWAIYFIDSSLIQLSSYLTVFYTILSIYFHHKVSISAFLDIRKSSYSASKGTLQSISNEYVLTFRNGASAVSLLGPKGDKPERIKLFYLDESGRQKFVRTIVSQKKESHISELLLLDFPVEFTFLTKSKILCGIRPCEDVKYPRDFLEKIARANSTINMKR